MSSWGSFSFAAGPLGALLAVGVLMLLLKWAFGSGKSLIPPRIRPGHPSDYGLLVRIAAPKTVIEAEMIRRALVDAGLRATLAPTTEGPAVMVWEKDVKAAKVVVKQL